MRQSSRGSHTVKSHKGAVRSGHVRVRECLRETVSSGSVVAAGVDREDRIVVKKVGCARRVPWSEVCEDCVT